MGRCACLESRNRTARNRSIHIQTPHRSLSLSFLLSPGLPDRRAEVLSALDQATARQAVLVVARRHARSGQAAEASYSPCPALSIHSFRRTSLSSPCLLARCLRSRLAFQAPFCNCMPAGLLLQTPVLLRTTRVDFHWELVKN